jgi:hypothetical protein
VILRQGQKVGEVLADEGNRENMVSLIVGGTLKGIKEEKVHVEATD